MQVAPGQGTLFGETHGIVRRTRGRGQHVAGKGRPGRRWGSLRGTSQEINDLSCLLRDLIDSKGIGLRQLRALLTPEHFTSGVVPPLSTLSERLSGKGLDWVLVEAVIDVCAEGAVAARRTSEAKRLWARHRHSPTPAHEGPPPTSTTTTPTADPIVDAQRQTIEAQAQLVRAVEARAASEQALTNSTQLISTLLVMISRLNNQITELERAINPTDRVRNRLIAARNQLTQAEAEKARAKTEQNEALFLARKTDERVEELKQALQRLNWEDPVPDDATVDVWAMARLVERASGTSDAVFLRSVSTSLRSVHTAIDECVQLLRSARPALQRDASLTKVDSMLTAGNNAQPEESAVLGSMHPPAQQLTTVKGQQNVWQSDEWDTPFPEVIRLLNDLYQRGALSQLDHILRDVSLLPADELAHGLIALRNAGDETSARRALKLAANRPGGEVFEVVLALRRRHLPDDAERLIWDFNLRQRGAQRRVGPTSPPGQKVAESWFASHYGPVPRFKPERWEFRVFGATAIPGKASFTFTQFQELPTAQLSADLHCVKKHTWPNNDWHGVMVSTLLDMIPPAADVTHLMVWAEYGYSSNLRLNDVLNGNAILATHNHGEPLSPEHGFPLRLVVPHLYGYKGPKWVRGIEYLTADRRGFWEERGYHNLGEAEHEQRYSYQEEWGQGPAL